MTMDVNKSNLTVSLITACYNSEKYLIDTIKSVLSQSYRNIEYIIVDGASSDGTLDIIDSYRNQIAKFISEPDQGIYDAINKGIRMASGDIIGILNSDDFFYDNYVVEKVVYSFLEDKVESVFGDVKFVKANDPLKVVRYYSSKRFHPGKFKYGFMPAHPSFYTKREFFERYGYYKTDYKIAADYELLIRFLYINRINYKYLGMPFVIMRTGGASNKTMLSNYLLNKEIKRACLENGIPTNYIKIYSKYLFKIFEFIERRKIQD
jgi:glycosyltransferase involved in cell wall biosynthesis